MLAEQRTERVTMRGETKPPFFIVGAQRSGTTMLRLMLNRHPHLTVPFESGFIPEFHRRREHYGDLSDRRNAANLIGDIANYPKVKKGRLIEDPHAILARPIENYADLVNSIFSTYSARRGKPRWGDKTPAYVTEIDILWTLFPGCQIIHLVRDGRDVALSLRGLGWGSAHVPRVAQDWSWKTTLAHKIGAVLGVNYLEVRYEDLVLKTEDMLRKICEFLREPFDREMLRFDTSAAAAEMPDESLKWHQRSLQPPDPTLVLLWKKRMGLADRIIFEQVAAPALALFGYELENHRTTWGSRLKNLYYSTLKRS
jgi:Sulfotransferase family